MTCSLSVASQYRSAFHSSHSSGNAEPEDETVLVDRRVRDLRLDDRWARSVWRCTAPATSIAPGELGRHVNPFIGTGGIWYLCGNMFPGATTPFGMVRLSPDTVSNGGRRASNSSGYYYRDERILGFSHTRLSGTASDRRRATFW